MGPSRTVWPSPFGPTPAPRHRSARERVPAQWSHLPGGSRRRRCRQRRPGPRTWATGGNQARWRPRWQAASSRTRRVGNEKMNAELDRFAGDRRPGASHRAARPGEAGRAMARTERREKGPDRHVQERGDDIRVGGGVECVMEPHRECRDTGERPIPAEGGCVLPGESAVDGEREREGATRGATGRGP